MVVSVQVGWSRLIGYLSNFDFGVIYSKLIFHIGARDKINARRRLKFWDWVSNRIYIGLV